MNNTVRYAAGDWYLVARERGFALLPKAVPISLLETVWETLETGGGLSAVIDALTGAYGMSLSAIPPFAVAINEADDLRVAVRGGVRVTYDDGTHQDLITGGRVQTWVEQAISPYATLVVTPPEARIEEVMLPVASGVVRAGIVTIGDGEVNRPEEVVPLRRRRRKDAAAAGDADEEAAAADDVADAGAEADSEVEADEDAVPVADASDEPAAEAEAEVAAPQDDEPVADASAEEPVAEDPAEESVAEEPVVVAAAAPVESAAESEAAAESEPEESVDAAADAEVEAPAEDAGESADEPEAFDEKSADATSADEASAEEAPADDAPADDAPADEAPADDAPADEAPADDVPADDAAADEVADDAPADDALAADAAADAADAAALEDTETVAAGSAGDADAHEMSAHDVDAEFEAIRERELSGEDGDHDGHTLEHAEALREEERAIGGLSDDAAFRGRAVLSTGRVLTLDRVLVLGRRPRVTRTANGTVPALVAVASPTHDISRNHIEIRREGESVLVTDLNTTNGTVLLRENEDPQRLHPGEATLVVAGDVIDIGDEVTVSFEDLP